MARVANYLVLSNNNTILDFPEKTYFLTERTVAEKEIFRDFREQLQETMDSGQPARGCRYVPTGWYAAKDTKLG